MYKKFLRRLLICTCIIGVNVTFDALTEIMASGLADDKPAIEPTYVTGGPLLISPAYYKTDASTDWKPVEVAPPGVFPGVFSVNAIATPLYVEELIGSGDSKKYYSILLEHSYSACSVSDPLKKIYLKSEIWNVDDVTVVSALPSTYTTLTTSSQSSSWSVNGSVGFFGDTLTGGYSSGYSTSYSVSTETPDVQIINYSTNPTWGDMKNVVCWEAAFSKDSPSAASDYRQSFKWVWQIPADSKAVQVDSKGRNYIEYATNLQVHNVGDGDGYSAQWWNHSSPFRVYLPTTIGPNNKASK